MCAEKDEFSQTTKQSKQGSSFRVSTALSIIGVPILLAYVALRYNLFGGGAAPPSDYGSGSMFDLIAQRYDTINRVLSVGNDIGWRKQMVKIIKDSVSTDEPLLLDMATGTADVALLLQKEMPRARIMGLDPSNNMLNVGRDKVRGTNIELQQADAQNFAHRFSADSFDAATMAFGIRNVPDRQKAMCEIHQVLKDQAKFCILEFSEPDDTFGILGMVARQFIRHVVPALGGILSGAPREYWHLQHSIKNFPSPAEFGKIIEDLRCDNTSAFKLDKTVQLNFGAVQVYVMSALKPEA